MLRTEVIKLSLLHKDDRSWLMDQLSLPDKERVEKLLQEVTNLQLTKNNDLTLEVLKGLSSDEKKLVEYSGPSDLDGLDEVDTFWQRVILSSLDRKEMKVIQKRLKINLDEKMIFKRVPKGIKNSVVLLLKERAHESFN